ncbi:unnamed protein product [Blepharisma stoltei]|uniref:Kinetochore protein Nuf2 n=1 Tax=Blepharisma stoltei TaxID=1481888 RepID=A0AAU9KB01_9CILI|nr:unnamed protein product [Blepharisma stoltei]
MDKYTFPLLSPGDIYTHLRNSLGFAALSEEDITKPKFDTIREIYVHLLQVILHKPKEEFLLSKPEHLQIMRNPELYDNSIPTATIYTKVSKILNRIGCKDDPFKLQDLLFPDFKRTRKFLSAFINYIKFMTEEQELIFDKNQESILMRVATEDYLRIKEEYEKSLAEVQTLKRKRQEKLPVIEEKQQRIMLFDQEKQKILEKREMIEKNIENLEKEINECEQKNSQYEIKHQELVKEIAMANKEIVESPHKIKLPLEQLKERLQNERNDFDEEQTKSRETGNKIDIMEKIMVSVKTAGSLIENCAISMGRYKELERQVNQQKQRSLELEKEIRQKKMTHSGLENDLRALEDRVNRINKAAESKIFTLDKSIDQKQGEKSNLLEQKRNTEKMVKEHQAQLSELIVDFENKQAEHNSQMLYLENEHTKLIKRAEEYRRNIEGMFENFDEQLDNKENFISKNN